jgi:hypothetical protein
MTEPRRAETEWSPLDWESPASPPRRAAPEVYPPWFWSILIVEGFVIVVSGLTLAGLMAGWWGW